MTKKVKNHSLLTKIDFHEAYRVKEIRTLNKNLVFDPMEHMVMTEKDKDYLSKLDYYNHLEWFVEVH